MKAAGPLSGRTVVVTGSRRAREQSALVSSLGGVPYVVPTVGISVAGDDSEVERFLSLLASSEGVDYAVFMTATGVKAMMLAAERLGLKGVAVKALNSPRTLVVARSGKPKAELSRQGIVVGAVPERSEATALGVVGLLARRGLRGKTVAVIWHGSRNEAALSELLKGGAKEVFECLAYGYARALGVEGASVLGGMGFRYEAPEREGPLRLISEIVKGTRRVDAITFTSPPAVRQLLDLASEHGLRGEFVRALREREVTVAAVGPSTKSELETYGVDVQVVPEVPAMGAMTTALAAHFARKR